MVVLKTGAVALAYLAACFGALACASAEAQQAPPASATRPAENPFAPYAFLIGAWDTGEGIMQRFSWGPERAYMLYSTTTRGPTAPSTCILNFPGSDNLAMTRRPG